MMNTTQLDGRLPHLEPPVCPPFDIPVCLQGMADWRGMAPKRVDLHCHTSHLSENLFGLNFRPLLNALQTYRLAKARGMDYVAITDHDSMDGCKALLDQFGDLPDLIVGEEVSAAFPEDGMCVHVNVFDINERIHQELQRLRVNIYDLVDYLQKLGKCYQLNHFTWNEGHLPFTPRRIEELVELFDVFEVLNGTRTFRHNSLAWRLLEGLGKAYTAGSDSHTDAVGTTFTVSFGEHRQELLANIAAGRTIIAGRFGSPANTRRDARILFSSNLRRMRREIRSLGGRLWDEARVLAIRMLYRPATVWYYLGQRGLMAQFEGACRKAMFQRRLEPIRSVNESYCVLPMPLRKQDSFDAPVNDWSAAPM